MTKNLLMFVTFICLLSSSSSDNITSTTQDTPTLRVLVWSGYHNLVNSQANQSKDTMLQPQPITLTLKQGQKCRIIYEDYANRLDLMNHLESAPGLYDIVITHNGNISELVKERLLLKLSQKRIPNTHEYITRLPKNITESNSAFVVPYVFAMSGLIYRRDIMPNPVTSWQTFFNPDQKLKSRLAMVNSPSTVFSLLLLSLHKYSKKPTLKDLQEAGRVLYRLKNQRFIALVYSNMSSLADQIRDDRISLAIIDSGSALQLQRDMPGKLEFVVPQEGSEVYIDGFAILAKSKNQRLAYTFINHQISPEIQAANALYQFYGCPNQKTFNLIKKFAPEQVKNATIYPGNESLVKSHAFSPPSTDELKLWEKIFESGSLR